MDKWTRVRVIDSYDTEIVGKVGVIVDIIIERVANGYDSITYVVLLSDFSVARCSSWELIRST